jgi:hypothetical protein
MTQRSRTASWPVLVERDAPGDLRLEIDRPGTLRFPAAVPLHVLPK